MAGIKEGIGALPGRAAVIYLTPAGGILAERLERELPEKGIEVEVLPPTAVPADLVRGCWGGYEGLVLIMAVGIAVRLVAPLLKSKWEDPGVVVVDEGGKFAVSLLGGHWGKGNSLTRLTASILGATPVVTTATDVHGRQAVDTLARGWGMRPVPRELVKRVNGAILRGERVVLYTEWALPKRYRLPGMEVVPWLGDGAALAGAEGRPVLITSRLPKAALSTCLCLCPPSLAAGIGCKRGVSAAEVEEALNEALRRAGRRRESVAVLASHEAKVDEVGLLEVARKWGLTLVFFGAGVLRRVLNENPGLADSEFVRQQMGVGGVCETAALAAVPAGELVLRKTRLGRVTVALAEAGLLWSESGLALRRI